MSDVNQPMMVIRKRLDEREISSPDFRTEDGVVQQTGDGGVTWFDSPANDVRHADAWRLPPIVADDPKCQAAANMTRFLVDWFEELLPILSAAGSAWALLSTLILLFVVLGPFALVIIMLDVAATLLGIGATAIGAAFTTEVFDTLTCIFYQNISGNGQVSAAQLVAINDDVDTQIGGTAATVLHVVFALVGEVGISNWGARGDAPADCSACCTTWNACADLLETNFDMEAIENAWGVNSTWALGVGWQAGIDLARGFPGETASFLRFGRLIPNSTYTRVEIDLNIVFGSQAVFDSDYKIKLGGETIFDFGNTNQSGTVVWTGEITTTDGHFEFDPDESGIGYSNDGTGAGGSGVVTRIYLEGNGCTPLPLFPCD